MDFNVLFCIYNNNSYINWYDLCSAFLNAQLKTCSGVKFPNKLSVNSHFGPTLFPQMQVKLYYTKKTHIAMILVTSVGPSPLKWTGHFVFAFPEFCNLSM